MKNRTAEILPAPLIEKMAALATTRTFGKNAIIVSEGDETDSLYIVLAGRAKVFVADENGREVQLNQIGPGEYFGEVTLDGGPRSASVMTLEPSRFVVIPKRKVRDFLRSQPDFAIRLIEKLIRRSRVLTASVKNLALMDVYGRVARLLLELAEDDRGELVIREKLTQQDIASRVGASREMVSKILGDLAKGGYLSISHKRIAIHKAPPRYW